MQNKTYSEDGVFYAVIWVNGHSYYKGPYHSRSTARRIAIQEQRKHEWARKNHMIYNAKYM